MFFKLPVLYSSRETAVEQLQLSLNSECLKSIDLKDIEMFEVDLVIGLAPVAVIIGTRCRQIFDDFYAGKQYQFRVEYIEDDIVKQLSKIYDRYEESMKSYDLRLHTEITINELRNRYEQLFKSGSFSQDAPLKAVSNGTAIYIYPNYCPGKHKQEMTALEYYSLLEVAYVYNASVVGFEEQNKT